eukprot:EG_transcript_6528
MLAALLPCMRATRPERGTVLLVSGVETPSDWGALCRAVGRDAVPVAAEAATFLGALDRSLAPAAARRDVLVQLPAGLPAPALAQLITVLRGSHVPVAEVHLTGTDLAGGAEKAAATIKARLERVKAGRGPLAGSAFDTAAAATPTDATTTTTTTASASTTTTPAATTTTSATASPATATTSAAAPAPASASTSATPSASTAAGGASAGGGSSSGTATTSSGATATSGASTSGSAGSSTPSTTATTASGTGDGSYNVITNVGQGYNWYRQDRGVGAQNGGWCTCPDGNAFMVGDNNDGCKTLACEGGSAGACSTGLPPQYAGMKVTCGWPRTPPAGPSNCAVEGGLCYCNGTVTYTDNRGNSATKQVSSDIRCTNAAFGTDPKPGTSKFCTCNPGNGVQCASDGGTCKCNGTVYYGAGANWTSVESKGSVACSKDTFGTDPSGLGSGNTCWCTRGYTKCADEGGTCSCSGAVQFGVGNFWTPPRAANGQIACSTSVFGDPYWGRTKACYCLPGGQS